MNAKIAEIKDFLKKNKMTYKYISEKTGIPEGTLKNIFSGFTKNPRIDTIQAIEEACGIYKTTDKSLTKNTTILPPLNSSLNNSLTSEEREILETYRNLPPHRRTTFMLFVKSCNEEITYKDKKQK